MSDALRVGDGESALRIAHTLKGLAATLGLQALHREALALERRIKEKADPAKLAADISGLSETLAATCAEISAHHPAQESPQGVTGTWRELLARLESELSGDDFAAGATWQELMPQLVSAIGPQEVATLARQIDGFEFADALVSLRDLMRDHAALQRADAGPDSAT